MEFGEVVRRQNLLIETLAKKGIVELQDFSNVRVHSTGVDSPRFIQGIKGETFQISVNVKTDGYGVADIFADLIPSSGGPTTQVKKLSAGEATTFSFPVELDNSIPDQQILMFTTKIGVLKNGQKEGVGGEVVHVQVRRGGQPL